MKLTYTYKHEEGGVVVYHTATDKRMNAKPFTSRSKARQYIKSLYGDTNDESKLHREKKVSGNWKSVLRKSWFRLLRR